MATRARDLILDTLTVEQEDRVKKGVGVDHLEQLVETRVHVNEHVTRLLCDARDYCAFERAARAGQAVYDLDEVRRVSEIRSVDFRLMHHALLQIASVPYDEEVFEWFRSFEVLMEIEDDLSSVADDAKKGGYNYYCFVRNIAATDAGQVLESLRVSLEQQLETLGVSLRSRGFTRCAQVFERYRRIVPRRRVPVEEPAGTQKRRAYAARGRS